MMTLTKTIYELKEDQKHMLKQKYLKADKKFVCCNLTDPRTTYHPTFFSKLEETKYILPPTNR